MCFGSALCVCVRAGARASAFANAFELFTFFFYFCIWQISSVFCVIVSVVDSSGSPGSWEAKWKQLHEIIRAKVCALLFVRLMADHGPLLDAPISPGSSSGSESEESVDLSLPSEEALLRIAEAEADSAAERSLRKLSSRQEKKHLRNFLKKTQAFRGARLFNYIDNIYAIAATVMVVPTTTTTHVTNSTSYDYAQLVRSHLQERAVFLASNIIRFFALRVCIRLSLLQRQQTLLFSHASIA